MLIPSLAVVVLLAGAPADPRLEAAEAQGRRSAEATEKGDYETVLDLTHPKIVALIGGREVALRRMRKEYESGEKMGIAFDSVRVDPATDLNESKDGLFCLVPMTLRLKFRGKILAKTSALLGVSIDGGKTWKFVDATKGEAILRKILPEIPEGLKIPKYEKAAIVPDTP